MGHDIPVKPRKRELTISGKKSLAIVPRFSGSPGEFRANASKHCCDLSDDKLVHDYFTARCSYWGEIVVSMRPARAAQKLIAAKTEMRMMIFTISTP
jgi:hypothetical protein